MSRDQGSSGTRTTFKPVASSSSQKASGVSQSATLTDCTLPHRFSTSSRLAFISIAMPSKMVRTVQGLSWNGRDCSWFLGRSAAFVRKSLGVVNGVLVGTASGIKVVDYLASHGSLELHEVPIMVDTLIWMPPG